ncbi:type II toxin-antitoxin system RelE/ParE family toxin [Microcoleus sp. MOSTC5]|uniref:type II toxin-antitoxin system RelE/ParE family toxin n=1 Tax=Microcoleus sp. MOSTC5 TaxID=3055378 RepID=UPI002FCF5724
MSLQQQAETWMPLVIILLGAILRLGSDCFGSLSKQCDNLVKFPNMGRSYDRIKSALRGVPLDGYIVFYRVVENGIEILRVMSGFQDLDAMFSDEN